MEAAKQGDLTDKNGSNEQCIEIEIPFDLFQYLSSNDCNIQNICRLCLSPKNIIMYPLLTSKDDNVLSEMLKAFTNIEIHQEETIPYLVCESCHNQVIQCYEFKLKCEKSDFTLKSILKGEFVIKTEEEIVKSPNTPVTKEPLNEIDIKLETHIPIKVEPDPEDIQHFDADMTSDNYATDVIEDTAKRKRKSKLNAGKMPIVIDSNDQRNLKSQKRTQKNLQCTYCSKIFLKVKTLQSHIKTKHKDVKLPFGCGQCKESFNSEHDLMVHSAVHSKGSTWSCNQCQKVFSGKRPLRRHIQRHMESKRYACEACGKTFVELYALRRHSRVHTGEVVEKKHACDYCDKRYSESCLLAAHVEGAHRGSRPCACECGKRFASPRLLASHRRLHDDRKPYACRYCDKRFRHESTRNTHHRTHTGEKPYVCSFCGKTFIQNSNLTLHLRTHTGERPYSCKKCERKFSSGSSLKAHERIHTGERPYSCPVCGKRFARMNMKTHMRLHSNERPHRCGACPKAYVTAYRLREHAKIHTDERPFECVSCLKNFSSRSHLMKHIKAHQLAKRTAQPQETVIVRRIQDDKQNDNEIVVESISDAHDVSDKGIILEESEVPLDVSEELVLQDSKTNLLVVGSSTEVNYERGDICLNSSGVNFANNDYSNDVNLVTVNEGGLSISSAGGGLEATTMKLYQVDQSLVQIHSSGGQVTISKITSKMTANF